LEVYNKEAKISQFDMDKMYNDKEVKDDIAYLTKQSALIKERYFPKNTKQEK